MDTQAVSNSHERYSISQQNPCMVQYSLGALNPAKIHKRRNWQLRAAEACEECRRKKTKCDEAKPRCGTCTASGMPCSYLDFVPSKQQKSILKILRGLEEIKTDGDTNYTNLQEFNAILRSHFRLVKAAEHGKIRLPSKKVTCDGYNRAIFPSRFPTTCTLMFQRSIRLRFPDFNPEYIQRGSSRPLLSLYDQASLFFQFSHIQQPCYASDGIECLSEMVLGSSVDSSLRIDVNWANYLIHNYTNTIQEMFPFLDLESVTRNLKTKFSPIRSLKSSRVSSTVSDEVDQTNDIQTRTQLQGNLGFRETCPEVFEIDPSLRTPDIAITLLVLALGAICGASEHLTAPLEHQEVWSEFFRNETWPIPSHAASPLQPTLMTNTYQPSDRNIDKVPGLKYYALAVRVLGEQLGGETLAHVQAFLLAGLYLNQLARVNESYSWIHRAGTTMQHLIKNDKTISGKVMTGGRRENMTKREHEYKIRCFWTCYQLESELLSDLDKPASGITEDEDQMPMKPTAMGIHEDSVIKNFTTMTQIFKVLNRARQLYNFTNNKACSQPNANDSRIDELNHCLDQLKRASSFWKIGKTSTENGYKTVSDARVKYMINITKCMITTPYVLYSLGYLDQPVRIDTLDISILGQCYTVQQGTLDFIEAIKAAALAFDGIHGKHRRLVLPNVFATAHALVGNLLILGAFKLHENDFQFTFCENWSGFLDPVMEIFQGICNLSPILLADYLLLDRLRQRF